MGMISRLHRGLLATFSLIGVLSNGFHAFGAEPEEFIAAAEW